jgi:TonB family protein
MFLRGSSLMNNAGEWKIWEGRTVDGKFPLRQWLGGSDHSAVFLTERPGNASQKFAIKLIPADAGAADRQLARLRSTAQLSHPHLLRLFEIGRCQKNGKPLVYVVMEYAEEDLSQILPQRTLAPAEVADMLPPVLDALAYLHAKGFVHGHIRPTNVLAVGDQLKISSDQISGPSETSTENRQRDVYEAPEIASGIVSPEGDLWSVGATLVAAMTRSADPSGATPQGDQNLLKTLPEPYRGIARECLHFDPKRRCSIADIKARLQPAARSVPAEPELMIQPKPTAKRGPIVAAALVAAAVAGFFVFHHSGHTAATEPSETPAQVASPKTEQPSVRAPAQLPGPTATDTGARSVPPVSQPKNKPAATPVAQEPPPAAVPRSKKTKPQAAEGKVIHQVLPDIPRSARNTISGTIKVVVQVQVDPSGKVTSARLKSAGPSQYFAKLALNAAQGWQFAPSTANNSWQLQFRFKRGSTQATPELLGR